MQTYAYDKSIRIAPTNPLWSISFCQEWNNLNNACWTLCVLRKPQTIELFKESLNTV